MNIHPEKAMQSLTDLTPFPIEKVETFFLSEPHIQLMAGEKSFREFFEFFKSEYSFSKSYQNFLQIWEDIIGEPKSGMEALVRSLSRSYKVILCSNTDPEHWRVCRNKCGFIKTYFLNCFLSYEMGLVKPSSTIYERMLSELSINPSDAVFIDDSNENINAAAKVGLKTIHATSFEAITASLKNLDINY